MKYSDLRPAPPIPPRRLKRKNKPAVSETDEVTEGAVTSVIRLEQRPRLPPPPPPQRSIPRRGIRPQEQSAPPEVKRNSFPESYSEEKCHSRSIIGDKLIANEIEVVRPTLSTFGTSLPLSRDNGKKPLGEEPARKKRDKGKIHRPNEYPPLFFTLQDFQDVMSDVENPYSRTLKNMSTFEPTPKPRGSKIPKQELPDTPKNENILFRVTTTNLPFERSLPELTDVSDDPNHFIFEDYVDRRQKPAQRKSTPSNTKLILFGDDTFDRDDEDQTLSTSHTASRVRFLVDSPTRNENCDNKIVELDSLQNIDSLPLDISLSEDLVPELKLTRDVDEDAFGDVPFDSLLSDPASSLCVDPSEDSTSSKTDFQTILVHATVEPIPSIGGVKKSSKNGTGISDANIESVEEKNAPLLDKVISKVEDICEKPKSPSFKKQNFDLAVECAVAEENVFIQFSEDRDEGVKIVDRREERKKITLDESLLDFMEVEKIGDKSPSENVRRNSFLMNMLQGDEEPVALEPEPKPEPEQDEGKVCKVVATHPKTPIHGSCRIDDGMEGGKRSAAVEAKSKLLGELSNSFSAIKLKPVNNLGEVEKKQSASDLKVDSMNVVGGEKEEEEEEGGGEEREIIQEVENRKDKDNDDENEVKNGDREAEDDTRYKLNRNLDSVLDSNVVKSKAIEEPIEESSMNKKSVTEPQDRSNVCSQKTDEIIIDKKNYVEDVDSLCRGKIDKIDFFQQNDTKKKRNIEKRNNKKKNVKESDNNNDDGNEDNSHSHSHSTKKKNNNDNSNNNNNNSNEKILEVASKSSVDKCAIVLKCNNNNDNNAMTPVDISYDQSQNNVSIIPGSVRSFVKFYEIQGETSVGLNSNDITAVVPKIKVEAITGDNFHKIISSSSSSKDIINSCPVDAGMKIENDIKYTIVTRKSAAASAAATIQKHHNDQVSADIKETVNQRMDESDKLNGTISDQMLFKIEGNLETQFSPRLRMIRSKNIGENESAETERTIKVETVGTSSMNNAGSDIAPGKQEGSTAGVRKDIVRSGTANHSVPKSSTSTINEHYTFYCTV